MRWSRFLAARTDEELEEAASGDETMEKAKEYLEQLSARPSVQELARQRELARLTYQLEITEARNEGEAKGRAAGVVAVLAGRGISLSEQEREAILSCRDLGQLDRWLTQALTASSAAELLP